MSEDFQFQNLFPFTTMRLATKLRPHKLIEHFCRYVGWQRKGRWPLRHQSVFVASRRPDENPDRIMRTLKTFIRIRLTEQTRAAKVEARSSETATYQR